MLLRPHRSPGRCAAVKTPIHAEQAAPALHPAPVQAVGVVQYDIVRREGTIRVHRAAVLPALLAVAVLAGKLDADFLAFAGGVVGDARRGLRAVCHVLRAGEGCAPLDGVISQAAAITAGGPGEGQCR